MLYKGLHLTKCFYSRSNMINIIRQQIKIEERERHVLGKYQLNFADMCWRRRISWHEISCWSVIVEELFPCVNDVANDEYLVTTNYNCSVSGRVEYWSRKFCLIVTKIHHYHRQAKLRAPPQYSTILSDQTPDTPDTQHVWLLLKITLLEKEVGWIYSDFIVYNWFLWSLDILKCKILSGTFKSEVWSHLPSKHFCS